MTSHDDRSRRALSREEVAKIEVGHTTIGPAMARVLMVVFLTSIGMVPILEWAGGRLAGLTDAPETAWSHLTGMGERIRTRLVEEAGVQAGLTARIFVANRAVLEGLTAFENGLEDETVIGRLLRPPAQLALSTWLGAGNERVYCGREGWLFYRPEVEYLTGPGFLDPAVLARRIATAQEWTTPPQPDPRDAIIRFARQLESRGITLVVMPTPLKPTVHPEKLARRSGLWPAPIQNPSYPAFVDDLRRAGVLVFDVADLLVEERRRTGRPLYLATDTHWRPETMVNVAESLGTFIRAHVRLPDVPDPGYRTKQQELQNTGDIAIMLDLPRGQVAYPPEGVSIRRVLAADGSSWRPSRSADVLVLGDSFSNIYSLASLGWGDSAGLTEQLSNTLRRPVDRILQNSDGAFATRALLRREIEAGTDRLAGKRVVVYQFAARELTIGDWQLIDLPPDEGTESR